MLCCLQRFTVTLQLCGLFVCENHRTTAHLFDLPLRTMIGEKTRVVALNFEPKPTNSEFVTIVDLHVSVIFATNMSITTKASDVEFVPHHRTFQSRKLFTSNDPVFVSCFLQELFA